MAQWVKTPTAETQVPAEVQVRSPALCSGLKDLRLPQLWRRTAVAGILSLAQELPCATDVARKKKRDENFLSLYSAPGEDIKGIHLLTNQGLSPDAGSASILILDFSTLRTMGNK